MLTRFAQVGVVLVVVAMLMTFAGCPPKAADEGSAVTSTPGPVPEAASDDVKVPEYSYTIAPPKAWVCPYDEPARLAGQTWGPGLDMPRLFDTWPDLIAGLENAKSFGILVRPAHLAERFWFRRNFDGQVMNLSQWPDQVHVEMDGVDYAVYVFQARSEKSPSWFQWGLRGPNSEFLGYATQVGQAGVLTEWQADNLETMQGGRITVYGTLTVLHTDTPGDMATPGTHWSWLREAYRGSNDYMGDKSYGLLPQVPAGQLPKENPPPWGAWPKQAIRPNLTGYQGVKFEDTNWCPVGSSSKADIPTSSTTPAPPMAEAMTPAEQKALVKGKTQVEVGLPGGEVITRKLEGAQQWQIDKLTMSVRVPILTAESLTVHQTIPVSVNGKQYSGRLECRSDDDETKKEMILTISVKLRE